MRTVLSIYSEIKKIAGNYNIIIYDDFIGDKTFIWHLKKNTESLILPSKKLTVSERLKLVISELRKRNTENIYLTPVIRELLDSGKQIQGFSSNKFMGDFKIEDDSSSSSIECEICGKEIEASENMPMLQTCQSCLRSQVRYNIEYSKCHKETMGRYCLDCPTKIYINCNIIKKTLNPEINGAPPKIKSSRLNRFGAAVITSNAQYFNR